MVFTPLQNLGHAFVVPRRAEFVLQEGFASSVEDTLSSVSIQVTSPLASFPFLFFPLYRRILLVSNENLPSVQHTSQRNGPVMAPVVEGSDVVDEDDKVFRGTLVEDLGVGFVPASHGD